MKIAFTGRPDAPRSSRTWRSAPDRTDGLGIDLGVHYKDLRTVAYGAYSQRCDDAGIDVEDLIGVVTERILRSNRGKHPFNPAKSNLIRYLRLMCASRLSALTTSQRAVTGRQALPRKWPSGEEDEADAIESLPAPAEAPDAAAVVHTCIEQVAWEARCDDAIEEDFPLAIMHAWDGGLDPENPAWSGWREQAVRWVVSETPEIREAAKWWGVAATEAAKRLQWGRQAWKAHLERIGVCK